MSIAIVMLPAFALAQAPSVLSGSAIQTAQNPARIKADAEMQQALRTGLTIKSVSAPELDGTYLLDSDNQMDPTTMVLYIREFNAFPGGLRQYPWPDKTGKIHLIPNILTAIAFFRAIADYTAALDTAYNVELAGVVPTWPKQPIVIR